MQFGKRRREYIAARRKAFSRFLFIEHNMKVKELTRRLNNDYHRREEVQESERNDRFNKRND